MKLPFKIIRYDPVKREIVSDESPIRAAPCPFWEVGYIYAPYIPDFFISQSIAKQKQT